MSTKSPAPTCATCTAPGGEPTGDTRIHPYLREGRVEMLCESDARAIFRGERAASKAHIRCRRCDRASSLRWYAMLAVLLMHVIVTHYYGYSTNLDDVVEAVKTISK